MSLIRTNKELICQVCGEPIRRGWFYHHYHPAIPEMEFHPELTLICHTECFPAEPVVYVLKRALERRWEEATISDEKIGSMAGYLERIKLSLEVENMESVRECAEHAVMDIEQWKGTNNFSKEATEARRKTLDEINAKLEKYDE